MLIVGGGIPSSRPHPEWQLRTCLVFSQLVWVSKSHLQSHVNRPLPAEFQNPSLSKSGQVHICKNEFYLHGNEKSFRIHIKGWTLNFVLIQRSGGTRKWLKQSLSITTFPSGVLCDVGRGEKENVLGTMGREKSGREAPAFPPHPSPRASHDYFLIAHFR